MSTSTPDSPPELSKQTAAAQKGSAPSVDPFVDKQIERTRRLVKLTDLLTAVGKLTVGFIVLLLIAAIGEHWLVPGGYGTNERMAFWAVAVIGGGVYFARYIFPLLTHRVNSLYAADELEREAPELKNSLVNLLQLREDGHTSGAIQKTLERQAAQRLASAKPQGVDQSHLIHVGYALVAVLAVTAIYVVFSPKDFFTTAGRVLSPWSELAAPSRVKIESLTPGDTTLAQGEQLEISLSILGLQGEEKAELIYSSDDGRILERRLALIPSSESSIGYSIQLPGPTEPLGLQSSISYRIEAGDARTRNYQADVLTTPAIAPVSIHFEYPAYTGLEDRHVDQGGDLRGIEGTKVTLTAEANLEIESAQIDFDADGRPDIRMESNGKQATAEFTLKRRNTNSGVAPYVSSYVIRYTTTDGQTNSSPPKYPLEIFADLPPEVSILIPEEEEVTISLDEVVPIQVEARDPDFALKEVWLIAQKNGRTILREQMLKPDIGSNGHQGRFLDDYQWNAREIGLQGGERIDYWAEALDVRDPSQRALSKRQVFLIRPDENPEQEDQSEEGGNEGNQSGDPSEGESGEKENPEESSEQNQSGEGNQSNQGGEGQNSDGQEGEASEQEPSEGQQGSEGSNENADGIQGEGDPNSESQNNGGEGGTPSNNDREQNQEGERSSGEGNRDADPNGEGQENQGGEPGNNQEQVQSNDDPVADDGSDDGAAFDRIQEHLAKKQDDAAEDRERQQVEGESDPNNSSDGEGQNAADPEAGEPDQGKPRDSTGADPERDPRNSESESESGEGKSSDSQSSESTESSPSGRNSKPNDDPREGTGSSGENQAADDGTGQSGDRGEGESTGREGNQQSGENENSSEKTEGEGSDTREGDGDQEGRGAKPNEKDSEDGKGQSSSGSPSDSNNSDNQSRESESGELTEQDPNREGNPNGPRRGGDRDLFDPNKNFAPKGELGEDEANLEYARKQTELVLNELEDQLQNNQVDEELLDKLGWSEEDLREFVERWQSRKQKAEQNPGKGSQELNDALRSLGLQQKDRRINGSSNKSTDSMRDLQQGNRSTIPPALREKLKRYNRGINNNSE